MKKKTHSLAEIFPELTAAAFDKLKDSIDECGQREVIVLLGDEILDGRNRYKACLELGRNPQFRNFDPARDGSPVKFVSDKNLNRRHLTPGQRAAVAKKIDEALKEEAKTEKPKETEDPKPDQQNKPIPPADTPKDDRPFRKKEADAAKAAGASARSVRDFKFVEKYSKADAKEVASGKISLNEGVQRAKAQKEAGSKFRNEAADLIEPNLGSEFAEKIRTREILRKDTSIREFNRLELKDQRRVKDLVEKGWGVKAALKFKDGSFEKTDTVSLLIDWFKAHDEKDLDEGGWASVEIDGHVFAVGKCAEKTDAEEV